MTAEARPSSLTLLPPISVIIVNIDRVVPNLAAAIAAFGVGRDLGQPRDVHHRPQPHRRHREADRDGRARSQNALRRDNLAGE